MSTKWYCCSRCNEVGSYGVDEHSGETTFNRGHFLVCGNKYDALVTGFGSKTEAEAWLRRELDASGTEVRA